MAILEYDHRADSVLALDIGDVIRFHAHDIMRSAENSFELLLCAFIIPHRILLMNSSSRKQAAMREYVFQGAKPVPQLACGFILLKARRAAHFFFQIF